MSLAKYFSIKRSLLVMIAGLIVFGIYLYFFIGIHQIFSVLEHVNSVQYTLFYSLALIGVLSSVFFWSAAWNSILRSLSIKIPYRRAYLYYWVSYFVDLVIPCATVCGELTRLYLVQSETKENYGALGAVAVTNRIVAYTVVTVGLYSGAFLIFLKPGIPSIVTNLFILFLVGVTIYMGVLLYLAFSKQAARNITNLYLKLLKIFRPKRYHVNKIEKTQKSLAHFYEGFQTFRKKPRLPVKPFILHSISYLLGLSVFVFIFYALGIPASTPEFYIVVFFITTAFQDATASFSVGSLEIFLATILVLYGISPGFSGVAAIVLRSAFFWFPLLVGFICVQIVGAKNLLAPKPETPKTDLKPTEKKIETTTEKQKNEPRIEPESSTEQPR